MANAKTTDQLNANMRIYTQVMKTPQEAQKSFNNGRFSGTDINPMWRIQKLTETFGPSGIGWWTQNVQYQMIPSNTTKDVAVFCSLELVYIDPETGKESKPVYGVGGNMFVTERKSGLTVSDEAYKMAYTDAVSIACKALGFSHDIYYQKDRTKYTNDETTPEQPDTSSEKSGSKMKDTPEKPDEDQLTMVRTQLHETVKKLVTSMDEQQKNSLSAKIKAQLGTANYLKCNDLAKLSSLLTELSAA